MNSFVLFATILTALAAGFLLGRWDKTVTEKQRIELVAGRLYVIMQEGDEHRKAGGRPEHGKEWCAGATWMLSRWMEGV